MIALLKSDTTKELPSLPPTKPSGSISRPDHHPVPTYSALEDQFIDTDGGELPPPFIPYHPLTVTTGYGDIDIVSHDPHLNEDGEALFRFILSQSTTLPDFNLHVRGTHSESSTNSDGKSTSKTVVDFDFEVDIGQFLIPSNFGGGPILWSVADFEPCFRGAMVPETDPRGGRQRAISNDAKAFRTWSKEQRMLGVPPWIFSRLYKSRKKDTTMADEEAGVSGLQSSRSIREWVDEYCASEIALKEFMFRKVVCGWNLTTLQTLIRSSILKHTGYRDSLYITFETCPSKVYVRPDNGFSRLISRNGFIKFYPEAGGKWEVCGAAYFLKRWVPIDQSDADFNNLKDVGRIARSGKGYGRLVGMREMDWFERWENTIIYGVREKRKHKERIQEPIP